MFSPAVPGLAAYDVGREEDDGDDDESGGDGQAAVQPHLVDGVGTVRTQIPLILRVETAAQYRYTVRETDTRTHTHTHSHTHTHTHIFCDSHCYTFIMSAHLAVLL